MRSGLGFDELAGDAQSIARLGHASFEHVAHTELAPDLPHVHGFELNGEPQVAKPLNEAAGGGGLVSAVEVVGAEVIDGAQERGGDGPMALLTNPAGLDAVALGLEVAALGSWPPPRRAAQGRTGRALSSASGSPFADSLMGK